MIFFTENERILYLIVVDVNNSFSKTYHVHVYLWLYLLSVKMYF